MGVTPTDPRQPIDPPTGLAAGTLLVVAAEALAFPAGLLVTIVLTRHLPAADYGALALALAAVAWLEWTVVTLFSRAAWKLIAEADDWRPIAAAVVRSYVFASVPLAALVFVSAGAMAQLFGVPALAPLLQVLAVEIPIFVIAQAYRTVLIGRGLHGSRAAVAALRWTVRALLVVAGVLAGASLVAIAVLIVAATFVELVVVRTRALAGTGTPAHPIGATTGGPDSLTMRRLIVYAAPLALSAICMRLFDRIDIFALRLLGGSIESVAAYGVAQNLALGPALFGSALTPALIAALSWRLARGDRSGARRLGDTALRVAFLMLPVTLLVAGAAPALIDLLFGARYADAAPLFALLVVGAAGTLLIALAGGLLVAAGRLRWTLILAAPLLLVALVGHLIAIPRAGAVGAATVTAATALLGAAAACGAARTLIGTHIPVITLVRGLVLGAGAGWLAWAWPARGLVVLPAFALIALLLAGAMALTGELRADERTRLLGWIRTVRLRAPS